MTPPASPRAATAPSTAVPTPRTPFHLQAVRTPAPAAWACDNCATPNAARRRRCTDCGTSRW